MKTAKEYWISKFPDAEKDWQKTGHDDNFQVRMMEEYAKYYHEQQVKNCDLADVGGALRELADKYEKDALELYENGDHALSHLHMAAQARYGFENGWKAAKKQ